MLIGRLNVAAAEVGLQQEHVTRVRPYLCTLQGEPVYSSISELYDSSDISMSAVTSGCPATPTSHRRGATHRSQIFVLLSTIVPNP